MNFRWKFGKLFLGFLMLIMTVMSLPLSTAALANALSDLKAENKEIDRRIKELVKEQKTNQAELREVKSGTAAGYNGDCNASCGSPGACVPVFARLGINYRGILPGQEKCKLLYDTDIANNLSRINGFSPGCVTLINNCGWVAKQKKQKELEARGKEIKKELDGLKEEKKDNDKEIIDVMKVCPQCALMESMPEKKFGDYLTQLSPLLMSVAGDMTGLIGMGIQDNTMAGMYGNYANVMNNQGLPIVPPMGMGMGMSMGMGMGMPMGMGMGMGIADGHGYGNGHADGYGNGHGYGHADDGHGYGYGHACGHGYGNGHANDGHGYGNGHADDGHGYGNVDGHEYGHVDGHEYGHVDGHGYGNGHAEWVWVWEGR